MTTEKAEQTLSILEDKRRALIQKATELADERQRVSFAAHTGDAKARQRLDKINAETATQASEQASIEAAITEANVRLETARRDEALAQDREAAKQLADQLSVFVECGQKIDMALAVIVESGRLMEATLFKMNQLGAHSPNNSQLTTLGALALHSSLMQTPWSREFRHLAPRERQSFAHLIEQWHAHIAPGIERRLGQQQEERAA